jgi:hypothetical protein
VAFFLALDIYRTDSRNVEGILAFTNYSFNVVFAAILVLRIIPAFGEAMGVLLAMSKVVVCQLSALELLIFFNLTYRVGAATAIIEIINREPLYPEVPQHTNLVVSKVWSD